MTAELYIVPTSETCVRYRLVASQGVIWSNRVAPTDAGHAGARSRMAAWALAHKVTVVQAGEPLDLAPAPKQQVIPGRYGRH